jgi:phosphoglycolate phosphatase
VLIIFDWDGTLSDSTSKIVHCVQQAAYRTGFPVLSDDAVLNIIGLGLPEAMQVLYPQLNDEEKERIRLAYIDCFLQVDQSPSPFFDGVEDGLQHLKKAGYRMAVATGKSRRGMNRVLDRLNMQHFFDASRCADETASKPHPLMLQELLDEFSINADQAVMVGDTEYDMDMAKQLNMPRAAVSYGAHHIDRMMPYQPSVCIDRFSELVEWVLQTKKSNF